MLEHHALHIAQTRCNDYGPCHRTLVLLWVTCYVTCIAVAHMSSLFDSSTVFWFSQLQRLDRDPRGREQGPGLRLYVTHVAACGKRYAESFPVLFEVGAVQKKRVRTF
jgi:hypothetical protein